MVSTTIEQVEPLEYDPDAHIVCGPPDAAICVNVSAPQVTLAIVGEFCTTNKEP